MIIVPDNYRSEWIESQDLEEALGLAKKTMYSFVFRFKDEKFVDGTKVDYGCLKAIHNERFRLWNLAHDYYFYLSDQLGYKDIEIAEFLTNHSDKKIKTWSSYLSIKLFGRIDEASITNINTNDNLVEYIQIMDEHMHELIKEKIDGSESKED